MENKERNKKAPCLRFKEFVDEWNLVGLDKACKINPANKGLPDEFIYIDLESIQQGTLLRTNVISKEFAPSRAQRLLQKGDVLFQTVRPYQKNHFFFRNNLTMPTVASTGFALLRSEDSSEFIYHLLYTSRFENQVAIRCTGSSYPAINSTDLAEIEVYLPSISEQQKVSSFFSLFNQKIEKQREKVEQLELLKKGMMQEIFSQQIRFKDEKVHEYPKWKIRPLRDVVELSLRPVPKPIEQYWRLGIRSHAKGTFHELVTDPMQVNMDTLYLVEENDLIVNITFAWEQAIVVANEFDTGKLVSHRFPTYVFKNQKAVPGFYKYYLTLPRVKYALANASPGGAGRNRVLNKAEFLKIEVPVPSIQEQEKIAGYFTALDTKIEKENAKLNSLLEMKKGYMQQMFI